MAGVVAYPCGWLGEDQMDGKEKQAFRGRQGHSWHGPPPYVMDYVRRRRAQRAYRDWIAEVEAAERLAERQRRCRRRVMETFLRGFGGAGAAERLTRKG